MIRRFVLSPTLVCLFVFIAAVCSLAQQPTTGLPPLGSFGGGPFDIVNLANLNVHLSIPVFSRAGRGIPFSYSLGYDSLTWEPGPSGGGTAWQPVNSSWGWRAITEAATGYVTYGTATLTLTCYSAGIPEGTIITYGSFLYHDPTGGFHPFNGTAVVASRPSWCGGNYTTPLTNAVALDNSGYILTTNATTATVNARGGLTIVTPPVQNSTGAGSITDANGNTISISSSGVITDTLGTALTVSGTPPGNVTYTYTAPNNNEVSVTVSYTEHWVQTCFEVSGISEYPATEVPLISTITLPDGSSYQFSYETTVGCGTSGKTTGRIASVTLPTGGTISYSYSGTGCGNTSNCMMADGGPASMTRTFSGFGSWTYTRAVQSGQQLPQTSTTVIDPSGNETDLNFSGVYETQGNAYNGNGGSKSLLKNTFDCYNGNFTSCPTAIVTPPITQKWLYDELTDSGLYKTSVQSYDQYGNVTGENDYGYATGSPLVIRNMAISYNSALCSSKNICDHPSSVQVNSGSGTQFGLTNYFYNGNGNATEVQRWVSGSSYLTQQYSYNGNGTVSTATDPNNTVTSYTYNSSICNGAFPTSVTVGSLTTRYNYNCSGGVVTSIIDPNGATTATSYTDPYFWRPASTTDALGNVTDYNYYGVNNAGTSPALSVTQTESVLAFNSSIVDRLNTVDGFGRLSLSQVREGPGSSTWDTIEYLYNNSGQVSWVTLPFADSAGTIQGNLPATNYTYDGLGRYVDIKQSPWTNLDIHYTYSLNDVEVTVNPAPTGENAKSRQLEYDALGRLTSVCEMTSMNGSGSCPQQTGHTGFYTSYLYDPLGDLTNVTQSTQSRSYSYDGLSRMTSESNPESGTTTYTYDSIGASYCAGSASSSPGDLTGKADAVGNHVCYYYDGLHRLTAVGNNNQSATNPCLRFAYDNSTGVKGSIPAGISIANPMGRMVEAETDNCGAQGDPTITDEWFSYSARGDQTDAWESTLNSGGWYHSQNQYAANGAISGRFGYLGTGTSTPFTNGLGYALDGEGRINGLLDTTINQWIWEGTTYSPANEPNQLQFYSLDSETFGWDPNSDRMLSWTSNVGTLYQRGNLTWNANGTLQQMAMTDTANTANTQTCTYLYDDLARSSNVSCGTQWQQSFNYDPWGNINKSGSSSFSSQGGSGNHVPGYSYDADGNVTNDTSNTYTYSVYGRPGTVTSVGTTGVYDAFTRLVEVQATSGNTQLLYAPDGYKFAYMNGQSVHKYIAPLAAGVQAVYTGATPAAPAYWRHSDWLGTVRMASTPTQTVYGDQAYGPFGESYNSMGTGLTDFTGQTKDLTSSIYDFAFRQYSQIQGRWMVPDPAGLAAVDITNPQTWNRYAYVANNPLSYIDPLGLHWDCTSLVSGLCSWETDPSGGGTGVGAPCTGCGGGGSGPGLWWGPGEFDLLSLPVYNANLPGQLASYSNTLVFDPEQITPVGAPPQPTQSDMVGLSYAILPNSTGIFLPGTEGYWAVGGGVGAANNGTPQQPQRPQKPQPQQPQKRSTLETVCGNWNLINGSWASINFGLWLASVTPAAPAAAPTATVSSTLNAISGLGQFAVCP